MDPPRGSPPSSPRRRDAVNREDPGPRPPDHRRLLRKILRTEEALRGYRPTLHYELPPPNEPAGADEILAALAHRYRPGDAIGLRHVVEAIDVTWEKARRVREWAISVGAWPYVQPGFFRPASTPKGVG